MRKIFFDIETDGIITTLDGKYVFPNLFVVCIYDSKTDQYKSFKEEELKELWPILETTDLLIGFNSDSFDIPVLNRYYTGDLTKIKSLDILKEIKSSYGRRMKLDQIAEGTLQRNKSGHGLEAMKWWKDGEYQKVIDYCIEDVRITKDIYEYARANNKLIFKEGGQLINIPLDTSNWESVQSTTLTHTLPF